MCWTRNEHRARTPRSPRAEVRPLGFPRGRGGAFAEGGVRVLAHRWGASFRWLVLVWILFVPGALVGAGQAQVAGTYRAGAVSGGGRLSGVVRYAGPIPEPYVIWVKKDADVFGEKVPDERLLISREGKVQNVVITLEGLSTWKAWPAATPTLDNRGGRFVPHVQVARRGTQLTIVNSDPVLHNTHGFQAGRTVFNVAVPKGRRVKQLLERAGIMEVMCDVHDWMNGWVVALNHPYFAVTALDGAYEIADIPPGIHKLAAWHEKLGRLEQRVTVSPGARVQANFTFLPSSASPGAMPGK